MNKMQYFLSILLLFFASQMNAQTIEQLRDSMAAGNLNYQVVLACKYIDGDGIEPDTLEAIRLLKDAVEKGNQFGELWLGACYTFGVGVEKDLTKAFHCYLSSAEKGNLAAMNNVGEAYEYGRGVEQNMKELPSYKQIRKVIIRTEPFLQMPRGVPEGRIRFGAPLSRTNDQHGRVFVELTIYRRSQATQMFPHIHNQITEALCKKILTAPGTYRVFVGFIIHIQMLITYIYIIAVQKAFICHGYISKNADSLITRIIFNQ